MWLYGKASSDCQPCWQGGGKGCGSQPAPSGRPCGAGYKRHPNKSPQRERCCRSCCAPGRPRFSARRAQRGTAISQNVHTPSSAPSSACTFLHASRQRSNTVSASCGVACWGHPNSWGQLGASRHSLITHTAAGEALMDRRARGRQRSQSRTAFLWLEPLAVCTDGDSFSWPQRHRGYQGSAGCSDCKYSRAYRKVQGDEFIDDFGVHKCLGPALGAIDDDAAHTQFLSPFIDKPLACENGMGQDDQQRGTWVCATL